MIDKDQLTPEEQANLTSLSDTLKPQPVEPLDDFLDGVKACDPSNFKDCESCQ